MLPVIIMAAIAFTIALIVRRRDALSVFYRPTLHTWAALGAGLLAAAFSAEGHLVGQHTVASHVLIYVGIYTICGALLPFGWVLLVERRGLAGLAITRERLGLSLALNAGLGTLFVLLMLAQADLAAIDATEFTVAAFALSVGTLFEVILYYGFIHTRLEQAFGIIPAILITAVVYVLWHTGTELTLVANPLEQALILFFVGVMYQSVFSIARNLAAIWPLFVGAGVMLDFTVNVAELTTVASGWAWAAAALALMALSAALTLLAARRQATPA